MTGFGMGESTDIKVKMPLQSLDILQRIENIIQQRISRGTVNVLIKIDN